MQCSHDISNFLEDISNVSHSIVFLYLFPLFIAKGHLISPCSSLELCIQYDMSFCISLDFRFFFLSIFKASSDNHIAVFHFFFLGMVLVTASSTMLQTSVHSSSVTLSTSYNSMNQFITSSIILRDLS